jgi:hypothetical protein
MIFGKQTIEKVPVVSCLAACIALASLCLAPPAATAAEGAFSYQDYADILRAHVDDRGIVDYAKLKENRGPLDAFAARIANLEPEVYDKWSEKQKIAFWINAYNALTLLAIIDHYPIKARFLASFRFPKNSIRQIPGVWDELQFKVMGRKITLDGIEHDTLRAKFNEPRIHMALVCAAMGCPPLRNRPYTGEKLDAQLDDQAARFLKNPDKFRIDRTGGYVYLSSIFKWFGEDFSKTYGTDTFRGRSATEGAVLNFVSRYLTGRDKEFIESGNFRIVYLDYDWTLNDRIVGSGN